VWNQFFHLQYFLEINERVFGNPKKKTKESEENRNFGIEGEDELLLAPERKRTLSKPEKQLLRRYYITAQEIDKLEEVFSHFSPAFYLVQNFIRELVTTCTDSGMIIILGDFVRYLGLWEASNCE